MNEDQKRDIHGQLGWIVGWKSIGNYIGTTGKTAKRWAKRHHLPVYKGLTNRPVTIPYLLDQFLLEYNAILKKGKKPKGKPER